MIQFDITSYLMGVITTWVILIVGFWIDNNFRPKR